MALSSLGGVVVGLTDTLVIGHFSTDALAGVALGATLYELPINALLGGLLAYRILAPRIVGKDKSARSIEGLRRVMRGLAPWICGAFVALMTGSLALQQLGTGTHNPSLEAAGAYLLGRSPSVVAETVSAALVITLVGWGRLKTPVTVFLVTSGGNLLFDFVLVYGIEPFPRLGALGDGIASSIGAFAVLPWLAVRIRQETSGATAIVPKQIVEQEFDGWGRLTFPAVGSAALDYGGNIVFTLILALGGTAGLAGARVATNVHVLVFVLVSSLSSAGLYIVGREGIGVRALVSAPSDIRRVFVGVGLGLGALVAILAWPIAALASPDPAVQHVAAVLIFCVAALTPIAGWAYANVTILRVAKRTGFDFVSNTIAVWGVQIPVALIGCLLFHAPGAFAGLAGYWLCRALISQQQVRVCLERAESSAQPPRR
ncbi:MATE family efflux transporter [Diaminobutyricibacter tongyongensis]|uniref:Probable multidrug resistance protein NorM n=2 Tax=Leifsonia tongyongensis TaxID=1268043 RepID=A0A6L9XSS0_9MICO|nr:MATE family efflux transporter [Diaminobutyricibacter tongyongensis]